MTTMLSRDMKHLARFMALFALMIVGFGGCARHEVRIELPAPTIIEGWVTQVNDDVYTIQEPAGQETRLTVHNVIMQDRIRAGEYVVVQYYGTRATAIARASELQSVRMDQQVSAAYP
jgi:hypothetical protein